MSAAFHSRHMAGVEEEFARHLSTVELGELHTPVVANVTARPYPTTGYADLMIRQISSPVRWHESVSWLMAQGHRDFHEIGPGDVLTRLTEQIAQEPFTGAERPPVPRRMPRRREVVFMYGGQGNQYPAMGSELYDANPAFRAALDRCSALYEAADGTSLVAAIQDTRGGRAFDDILQTHAALYSIGWSLTEALRADGFTPDAVVGHSLGEYVAATVAGAMSLEDGLDLVMKQAHLVKQHCRTGGMLSVLAGPGLYRARPELFAGLALAGVHHDGGTTGNFVVSGSADRLAEARALLDEEGVTTARLPVRYAFHSELIDDIRHECHEMGRAVAVRRPELPVHSAACAGPLREDAAERWGPYVWDVIRGTARFDTMMATSFPRPERHWFVDLSPGGSLAGLLGHGYGPDHRGAFAIDRFTSDTASMRRLREGLRSVRDSRGA